MPQSARPFGMTTWQFLSIWGILQCSAAITFLALDSVSRTYNPRPIPWWETRILVLALPFLITAWFVFVQVVIIACSRKTEPGSERARRQRFCQECIRILGQCAPLILMI